MIKSIVEGDILEGLKRLDHVVFSLPCDGGKTALDAKANDIRGYNFLHYLRDEYTVPIEDAPSVEFSAENLGTMWTHEDEEAQVHFHGVYNHSMAIGWHSAAYEIVTRRLDAWWEEVEDGIVRPVRSLVLGHGDGLSEIAAPNRGYSWDYMRGYGALANSEAEFACFYQRD